MSDAPETPEKPTSLVTKLDAWGSSAMPPMAMATLIASLHTRPLQPLPLLFAPALLFSGYVNVAGYAIDAAGMTAAWSGLYVLLSLRRPGGGAAGAVRGAARGASRLWSSPASMRTSTRRMQTPARRAVGAVTMALGTVNCVAGAVKYGITGDRAAEAEARRERDRWGMERTED